MSESYKERFDEMTKLPAEEQAKAFLRSFVLEFKGNFEEVLELCKEFKSFVPEEQDEKDALEDDALHRLLESRGETQTVKAVRDSLTEIELDHNRRTSFLEFALWKYRKSLREFFAPVEGATPELLAALEEAIKAWEKVQAEKKAREDKMAQLRSIAKANPGSVKGKAAANQLEQMESEDELERNRSEVTAAARKRRAEKDLAAGDGGKARQEALKKEEARLKAEAERKEAEEKAKRDASRQRLAQRAALFQ